MSKIASEMAILLNTIEKKRERYKAIQSQMKTHRDRLLALDDELIDSRAELVSAAVWTTC